MESLQNSKTVEYDLFLAISSRDVHGGSAKLPESEHKFDVRKCNILRLDESYRLVTTVIVVKFKTFFQPPSWQN
jgi:hypothetical protein